MGSGEYGLIGMGWVDKKKSVNMQIIIVKVMQSKHQTNKQKLEETWLMWGKTNKQLE